MAKACQYGTCIRETEPRMRFCRLHCDSLTLAEKIKATREAKQKSTQLTREDWTEIYYALLSKLNSPTVEGRDKESKKWRAHLRLIISKIGPDGDNMKEKL